MLMLRVFKTFLFEFLNGYSICRKKNKEKIPKNRKIVADLSLTFEYHAYKMLFCIVK